MLAPSCPPPVPTDGYAYEFRGSRWMRADDEAWDTIVHTAATGDRFVGIRTIDGHGHNVWRVEPGRFVAQLRLA